MAASTCAPDLEDGELFLPKDIFPDEDDLLLWRSDLPMKGGDVEFDYGTNNKAGYDLDLDLGLDIDLSELASKLASLGLGLGVLPRSECRGGVVSPFLPVAPSVVAPPPLSFSRCGADTGRFDHHHRLPLPPRKLQQHQQPPWVLGPRAAEAMMLRRRQQQQRAAALFAARASTLGLPLVDLDGLGYSSAAGPPAPPPHLLPRVSSPRGGVGGGERNGYASVTQACNGNACGGGGSFLGRQHHLHPHALPSPVARRRCGGTGVFLPRVSSPASTTTTATAESAGPPAGFMLKSKSMEQQFLPPRFFHQESSPALAPTYTGCFGSNRILSMSTDRDAALYPAASPAVDWSHY